MVDLRAKPYNLSDSDIAWVENTIASMTAEEKVGLITQRKGAAVLFQRMCPHLFSKGMPGLHRGKAVGTA